MTEIRIVGDVFYINGIPTYKGREWNGHKIEGLLMNSRMVQGIFDDLNPETADTWKYPDTGEWDSFRNTREFCEAMSEWKAHGLTAFTINLQGGSPQGYSQEQPWHNSGITEDGELRTEYLARLEQILDRADEVGLAVILGIFYFGQDHRLKGEAEIFKAIDNVLEWLRQKDYRHILIEVNNECDVRYTHAILKPERVDELVNYIKTNSRFPVGTSYGGGSVPGPNVERVSDFLLMHGNGVEDPNRIAQMVRQARKIDGYTPKPIIINEDDHFEFDKSQCNMTAAISEYCSWGYFDPGESNYRDGYQCPPVNWGINTPRKKAFFSKLKEITGV